MLKLAHLTIILSVTLMLTGPALAQTMDVVDTLRYTEDDGFVGVDPAATVDFGGTFENWALRVRFINLGTDGEDTLTFIPSGALSVNEDSVFFQNGWIGTLTISENLVQIVYDGDAAISMQAVQATVRRVVYANISQDPDEVERTLRFRLFDGVSPNVDQDVIVQVTSVNDLPIAQNDAFQMSEDVAETFNVLNNDADPDHDPDELIIADLLVSATLSTVEITPDDDAIVVTPPEDFSGTDGLQYIMVDAEGGRDTAAVALTIVGVNDDPIVVNPINNLTVPEDPAGDPCYVDLSTVFTDIEDGTALNYEIVDNTNPALVSVAPDEACLALAYPTEHLSGQAIITVRATDNGQPPDDPISRSVDAVFTIDVTEVNDPPFVASAIADTALDQNTTGNPISLSIAMLTEVFNDIEDGTNLAFSVSQQNPLLINIPDNTPEDDLVLELLPGVSGRDTISVTATDNGQPPGDPQSLSVTDEFIISIGAVNSPPQIIDPLADVFLMEDALPLVSYVDLRDVFRDNEDGSNLAFELIGDYTDAAATPRIEQDSTLTVTPVANESGTFEVVIRATDSGLGGGQDILFIEDSYTVTVEAVNDTPFVIGTIADFTSDANGSLIEDYVFLQNVFSDLEDGSDLEFNVSGNTNTDVVTAVIDTNDNSLDLMLGQLSSGVAQVTLQATDRGQPTGINPLSVNLSFLVTLSACPQIQNAVPEVASGSPVFNDPIPVHIELSVGSGVGLNLIYADGNDFILWTGSMTEESAGIYSATIPAAEIDGTQLYVEAVIDGCPTSLSSRAYIDVLVPDNAVQRNIETGRWQMFSVPYQIVDAAQSEIGDLLTDLGPEGDDTWRIYKSQPDGQSFYDSDDLSQMGNLGRFTPGNSFWMYVQSSNAASIEMPQMLSRSANETVTVALVPGWNQVANPFGFDLTWGTDVTTSSVDPLPVYWYHPNQENDGWNSDLTTLGDFTLQPWDGYAIYNGTGSTIDLNFEPDSQGRPQPRTSVSVISWKLIAEANSSTAYSRMALGMASGAATNKDALDYPYPMDVGNPEVATYFYRPDWADDENAFMTDFRPINSKGDTWQFTINSVDGSADFRIENTSSLPAHFDLVLFDRKTGEQQSVREAETVRITGLQQTLEDRFVLLAGTAAYLTEAANGLDLLIPSQFELGQNFPNPFNPSTRIAYQVPYRADVQLEVFDITGRLVVTLVDRVHEGGYYQAEWRGTDLFGVETATGIYFLRMSAAGLSLTRKMVKIE